MILDASAIVAILGGEPEADVLLARMRSADVRWTHPVSLYEAALALRRVNDIAIEVALTDTQEFLETADIQVLPLEGRTAETAVLTFARFGRGHHPAKLNMGDCFSYACAKLRGVPLLYKGDDFAKTDLG